MDRFTSIYLSLSALVCADMYGQLPFTAAVSLQPAIETSVTQSEGVDPSLLRNARRRRKPQCRDRRDNDSDGKIDYPADEGCMSKRDRRERNSRGTDSSDGIAPEAGASLNGRRLFPLDNSWNQDVSAAAVDPNSNALLASIGLSTGLHPDFGTVWEGAPIGIPYIVVGGNQPKVPVTFEYASESDPGPYPIPASAPIEGGPDSSGDRHVLIVDKDNWILYELYSAYPNKTFTAWTAGSGAIFDLNSNSLRPAGWTSADAAGLPILPGLVRYDEVFEQGEINHALRFTAARTRRGYVAPARHFASSLIDTNLPPMGMRVRLKASFNESPYSQPVQVILRALKRYGMILADNGSNWYISGAPDSRWDDDMLRTLRNVKGSDFEVVEMGEVVTE